MQLWKMIQQLLGFISIESHRSSLLWDNYKRVMATRLTDTFRSTSTLTAAHDMTISQGGSAVQYGCSNYTDGSAIADKVRYGTWTSTVLPIIVDAERDFMCFMVIQNPGSIEDFSEVFEWIGPALAPLKIHDSIYKFVESNDSEELVDLTMFRHDHFRETDSISLYDMSVLKKFYWSSCVKAHSSDNNRKNVWKSLPLLFNTQNRNADPCLLGNGSFSIKKGRTVIPIDSIVATKGRDVARACVAYLAATFAQKQYVTHIALTTRPKQMNFRARSIQQNAALGVDANSAPFTAVGLMGDGQIVTVADEGLDINSCYFFDPQGHVPFSNLTNPVFDLKYRKVMMYVVGEGGDTSDEVAGHGTHVCGTVAGSIAGQSLDSPQGMYGGVAPNAKIAFLDLATPGSTMTIPPAQQLYGIGYQAGSRVHTNSWGNYFIGPGYYSTHDADDFLFQNQKFMIFFAAGNNGDSGSDTITIDASGKNTIAVGSSETTLGTPNISYVSWYSSKGPVYDNRIKPDLVAPGDQLMSARASGNGQQTCETLEYAGTSMASPSAAGNALLVRQYFIDSDGSYWTARCNPNYRSCKSFEPSGPLVKAVLINSAVPLVLYNGGGDKDIPLGTPPDYSQGFGRINLANVLPVPGLNNFDLFVDDQVRINQYQTKGYQVILSDVEWMKTPLRITLCWYDPPNTDGATWNAMLQNIDLTVVSPAGYTFYPNGLTDHDYINTVERFIVDKPDNGVWRVFVSAVALPVYGYQLYSLVIISGGYVIYT